MGEVDTDDMKRDGGCAGISWRTTSDVGGNSAARFSIPCRSLCILLGTHRFRLPPQKNSCSTAVVVWSPYLLPFQSSSTLSNSLFHLCCTLLCIVELCTVETHWLANSIRSLIEIHLRTQSSVNSFSNPESLVNPCCIGALDRVCVHTLRCMCASTAVFTLRPVR